jgi:C4-dicarboxylate-specific signal transduction histidine kinase/CheY-like chemotaxis protein
MGRLGSDLRLRAERAANATRDEIGALSPHEVQALVYELQVHQIELSLQNETLRQAQDETEQARAKYEQLYAFSPASCVTVDADGLIVQANHAAAQLLDVPCERLPGARFAAFVATSDLAELNTQLAKLRVDSSVTCELEITRPSAAPGYVRAELRYAPTAAPSCWIVLTDISEARQARLALEQLNRELESRVARRTLELEQRNRELVAEIAARTHSEEQGRQLQARLSEAERLEGLGLLAGGIAHDFNNLLVVILGGAELALRLHGLPEQAQGSLHMIEQAARTAADLTRQMLIYAGLGRVTRTRVSLGDIIVECLAVLCAVKPANVQLTTELDAVPAMQGDRAHFHQIVSNLVTNALEAIRGNGAIQIQLRSVTLDEPALASFTHHKDAQPGSFALLRVRDSGGGIATTNVARIFDPFFTTKFTGRGLGLACVLGIVQSHKGAMRVQSTLGEGSCFEVALPFGDPSLPLCDSAALGEPSPQVEPGSGAILLIDDDPGVRRIVAGQLESMGFQVVVASDGAQGIELFRCADPAFRLVVLDWTMPGLSGEQVMRRLRELAPAVPILLISGYGTEQLVVSETGVALLQKPMTSAELSRALSQLISDAQATAASAR